MTREDRYHLRYYATLAASAVAIFLLLAATCRAMDHGFDKSDRAVQWFEKLMRPDVKQQPCCGKGDAYQVVRYWRNQPASLHTWTVVIGDGSFISYPDGSYRSAIADGTEVVVPDTKVNSPTDDLDNPTDFSWVFMAVDSREGVSMIYCFIPHPQGN